VTGFPASVPPIANERAFTMVEVMVAIAILLVGVLGAIGLADVANKGTGQSNGRDGATSIARRVLETARQIPYDSLTTSDAPAAIQAAAPDLQTTAPGGWTLDRTGFTYTLSFEACAVDDPTDGLGAHADPSLFCADSTGTGSADQRPADYRRASVTLSWRAAGVRRTIKQATVVLPTGG
jgi:prepilin-type N-terminal cleavage/methylation domain-containing protein